MPQYLNTNRMFSLSMKSENPLFFKEENKVLTEAGKKKRRGEKGGGWFSVELVLATCSVRKSENPA